MERFALSLIALRLPVAALALLLMMAAGCEAAPPPGRSLAERLGYKATDRLLIINGDDFGMCHSANTATIDSLTNGLMTSTTVMVPCPWFLEVVRFAKANPKADIGVHLTHTSEWQVYRWGPVSPAASVPGLVDPQGYLWQGVEEVYGHAKADEALAEARAQLKRALGAGIDVTHLDSHMGAMQYNGEFHRRYLQLAVESNLPVRMGSPETYEKAGFPSIRKETQALGLVFPDRLVHEESPKPGETRRAYWKRIVTDLKPGVTELYIHAATLTEESKATTNTSKERAEDYELFTHDPEMKDLLKRLGIIRIGYRELRDLQRRERAAAGK
ncbi:MAG: polysaccharide deacetylase family protein [Armatimonadetes bacterium]|nr:polysaccharide deacetylase family protein [Armatimonadota bacterium]